MDSMMNKIKQSMAMGKPPAAPIKKKKKGFRAYEETMEKMGKKAC